MSVDIQKMVQTIVAMKNLQLQEQAQRLNEEQMGISRQNAQGGALSGFQNLLQNMSDPSAMAPYAGQFAGTTGLPQDAVNAIIQGTPSSQATTRSRAVQSGARQLGGSQDVAATTQDFTGMSPGGAAKDRLVASLFGGTSDYYSGLPDESKQNFQAQVLQQIASGQDVGSAAMSSATAEFMGRAPKDIRDEIVRIGKGLAPSASEAEQQRLGWSQFQSQQRLAEAGLALEDVRAHASLMEAQGHLSKQAFDAANELINKRAAILTDYTKGSATVTKEGRQAYVDQFNAYNEQLRQVAPEIYGPKGTHPLQDLPTGASTGASGVLPFLSSWLSKPH